MSDNMTSILNDLVETSKDGEQGFRAAANDTKNAELQAVFLPRGQDCATGAAEDVAKASYRKALEKKLPEDIRVVVQRQYDGVLRNHDQIRALRDRYRAKQI